MIPPYLQSGLIAVTILGLLAVLGILRRTERRRAPVGPAIAGHPSSTSVFTRLFNSSLSARSAGFLDTEPAPPILIVENAGQKAVPLSRAVRNAGFINPLISLPDDQSVELYMDGNGAFSNRKKYPLPAIVLQDHNQAAPHGDASQSWLEEPQPCRQVVVTVMSGAVEARHFESAVPIGRNAILCKLQNPDSMQAMFRVLRRTCLDD